MSQTADIKVARRYAGALFGASKLLGKLETVANDMDNLASLWSSVPTLHEVLVSPLVESKRKHSLLDEMFGNRLDVLTVCFLHLLVDKRREEVIPVVRDEYRRLTDEAHDLIRAHATSAVPMNDQQRSALVVGLQQRTGKEIELTVSIDPAVIGGMVVRMNDTVIDGSVRGALEKLRERMLHEA